KTASDPVDRWIAGKRLLGRIRIGCLRIVYIAYSVYRIYQLLSVSQARERANRYRRNLLRYTCPPGDGVADSGILPVMRARQSLSLSEFENPDGAAVEIVDKPAALDIHAPRRGFPDGDRHNLLRTGAPHLVANRATDGIVDTNHGGCRWSL